MALIAKIEDKLTSNKSSDLKNQEVGSTHTKDSTHPSTTSDGHVGAATSSSVPGMNGQGSHLASHTSDTHSSNTSNIHPARRSDNTQVNDFGAPQNSTPRGYHGVGGSEANPFSSGMGNTHHIPGTAGHNSSDVHAANGHSQPTGLVGTNTHNTHGSHNPTSSLGPAGVHPHSTSYNTMTDPGHSHLGSGVGKTHHFPGSNVNSQNANTSHGLTGNHTSHGLTGNDTSHGLAGGNNCVSPQNSSSSHQLPQSGTHTMGSRNESGLRDAHNPTGAINGINAGNILGPDVHGHSGHSQEPTGHNSGSNFSSGVSGSHSGRITGGHTSSHTHTQSHGTTAHHDDKSDKTAGLNVNKENYDAIPEAGGLKVGSGPFEHDRSYNPAAYSNIVTDNSAAHSRRHSNIATDPTAVHSHGKTPHSTDQLGNIDGHQGPLNHTIGHDQQTHAGHALHQINTMGSSHLDQPLHDSTAGTHMSGSCRNGEFLSRQNVTGADGSHGASAEYNQSMAQHQADQMMR